MKTLRVKMLPLLCGLLCGAFLVSTIPAASEARQRRKVKKTKPSKKKASKQAKKKARALFNQAQKYYRLGRFARARELYEKAYELLPLPGFLYNIAQCHRMEKRFERAIFFYRSYLGAQSSDRNRDLVLTLIARCEKALERQRRELKAAEARRRAEAERARAERLARLKAQLVAARRPPPYLPPVKPKDKPLVQKWWFWTSIAGGVVALVVTGVVVGLTTTGGPGKFTDTSLGLLDRR